MSRARLLSLAVLGWLLAGAGEAQVFRVVAFGDSITYALPFDLGNPSCRSSDPDTCGLTGRLASSQYYGCGSANCAFANRGKAGERTAQAVSRADQVLRERDWSLMILMEGTNDLGKGVSPQTVLFNLNAIAAKAENRGVGVTRASIIQYNPSVASGRTASLNSAAKNLRGLISGQAGSDRHCFVDAWARLCNGAPPGSGCLVGNYWTPPAGTTDFVGHPNSRGYDVLAKEFHRVLGSRGAPGAVEIVAPTGDGEACGEALPISWARETVANSRCGNWFRVQISGPAGTRLDRWFQESDVCGRSGCDLTAPVKLKGGSHSVRIQTRNTSGFGPWSAEESFTSVPSAPRQIQALFGPEGDFYAQGGLEAEFKWKADEDARSYRLEVRSGSKTVVDRSLTDEVECGNSQCSFSLDQSLPTGRYTWRVLAENVCGGTWSRAALFEIFDGPPALAPQTLAPERRIFDSTPVLRWQPVAGADAYEVEDAFGNATRLAAADVCRGDTCRRLSAALAPGLYSWRVRAVNPLGDGPWSPAKSFEVVDCDCFEGRGAGGTSFLLAVPDGWNGDLVIWSHGSNPFGVLEFEDFGPLAQRQFDQGYALATTSYSVSGWPLFRSKRDLEKVFSVFSARHGRPRNVFLAGESAGALVAAQVLEGARLGNVVGALAMCGPLAGTRNWEAALDLRLAYDAVCADVAGADIPGGPKGLPSGHQLEPADIAAAVDFCTGLAKDRSRRTKAEKDRLATLLGVTGLVESGLQEAMRLATFGLSDLVRDRKKLKGKVPVGNVGVVYDAALDGSIRRVEPEPKAERKLADASDLSGRTGGAKVVSLHTSKDPVFFVENQREYADLVPESDLLLGIVKEPKATHCGFNEVEELAAWEVLRSWAGGGSRPKPKNLQQRCTKLRPNVGGSCRFDPRPKIDAMDSRVAPRP